MATNRNIGTLFTETSHKKAKCLITIPEIKVKGREKTYAPVLKYNEGLSREDLSRRGFPRP